MGEFRYFLGWYSETGKPFVLTDKDLGVHGHWLASSGGGKTVAFSRFAQEILNTNFHGLIVFDWHEDLYSRVRDYLYHINFPRSKIILINPYDSEKYGYTPGINFFQVQGSTHPSVQVEHVLEVIRKVYKMGDQFQPLVHKMMIACTMPAIEVGLTFPELFAFVGIKNPALRERVLEETRERDEYGVIQQLWESWSAHGDKDRATLLAPIESRSVSFISNPMFRRLTGQLQTIDWLEVLEKGKVVLINMRPSTRLARDHCRMLAAMILHQIFLASYDRPVDPVRRTYCLLDEFGQYTTDLVANSMEETRKRGVFFHVAHQHLEQLRSEDPKLAEAVLGCTDLKVIFRCSRADAEEYVNTLFAGEDLLSRVREEYETTIFEPVETTRKITSHTDTDSSSDSHGDSSSVSTPMSPYGSEGMIMSGTSHQQASMSGSSYSETVVPFYEYLKQKEISHRDYFSMEEVKEMYIGWMMRNKAGQAFIEVKRGKPGAVQIAAPEALSPFPKHVERWERKIYESSEFALPNAAIDTQMNERREKFIPASLRRAVEFHPQDVWEFPADQARQEEAILKRVEKKKKTREE